MAWLDAQSACEKPGEGIKPGSVRVINYVRKRNTKVMAKKKFTFIGERTVVTARTISVLAEDEDEARDMIDNRVDCECDDMFHHDDEKVYTDEIDFSLDDEKELSEEEIQRLEKLYKK